MKILFTIYQLDYADHIAIAYLSAIAKQLGHLTFFCNMAVDDLTEIVKKIKPDVVAYSVNIMGYPAIKEAHKKAKKAHNFISIMGGPHPTFSPETFEESGMDVYCRGEGEYSFRDFLLRVAKGEPFDDVLNLITKKGANPVRPLIQNLDELPFPDRHLTLANSFLKNTPKKTFYTTRGCPFACAYCSNNHYKELYKGKGVIFRRFSVERVIREIEEVKANYRMDFVKFGDDLFAMSADAWLEEFAEKYPKRIGVPFNCFLRFDRISDELIILLKKAGCFSVHLSVDSTSERIRNEILQRNFLKIDMAENLKKIRSYGIATWVNYMLAVPESTLQDDLDTINLSRQAKVTYPAYSTTVPMKGTQLYKYCVERGYLPLDHKSDMSGCWDKTDLLCFDKREKDIRYNVFLLGAIVSKLPFPLYELGMFVIKNVPPNKFFRKIRNAMYKYYVENKIFALN